MKMQEKKKMVLKMECGQKVDPVAEAASNVGLRCCIHLIAIICSAGGEQKGSANSYGYSAAGSSSWRTVWRNIGKITQRGNH